MIFEILEVQEKAPGWKVAKVKEAIENGQTFVDVSINEKNREGVVEWPNFAQITVGATIEGDYWRNPAGKQYIYAPKRQRAAATTAALSPSPSTGTKSFGGGGGVKAAQERKAEGIKEAQENKKTGVMIAAAMRDATAIALAAAVPFPTDEEFMAEFMKWRDWYLKTWHDTEKDADIPF